jgi:cysteine desulfurase
MAKKIIYLDNASTTPVSKEVIEAMKPFFSVHFGNPSSIHSEGVLASKAIENSRRVVSESIHAHPDEIIFTSGGTEANNLAIFGLAEANNDKKGHIITVETEHASVLEPVNELKKLGWDVSVLKTDKEGFVNIDDLLNLITIKTVLVSIMYANNEIGVLQQIPDIGRAILKFRKENQTTFPFFHSDACQAAPYLDLDVEKLHVDLMTVNGGKIYGPKGVGALFVRRGVNIKTQVLGGGQERNLRSGTENVPSIVGFAKALQVCNSVRTKESRRLMNLSQHLFKGIKKIFADAKINGPEIGDHRLVNNLNINFGSIDGEQMVIYLDSKGILCSTASACSATNNEPSHVLKAIGLNDTENRSSVRFSLGRSTTLSDIKFILASLKGIKKLLL